MVDSDFEDYVRREEFERLRSEMREQIGKLILESKDEVQRFVRSQDQYLRENEYKLTMLLQRVELATTSFTQMISMQTDFNQRTREDSEQLALRVNEVEKGILRVENGQTEIFDAIYGNPARPDANPSLMKVLREHFDKSAAERELIMEQLEILKMTVERWQALFVRISNVFEVSSRWIVKTTAGRAIASFITGLIVGRSAFPQEMDQLGEIIVTFIRQLFGIH